jgi:Stage II sporulation protein E (SpoIIE)
MVSNCFGHLLVRKQIKILKHRFSLSRFLRCLAMNAAEDEWGEERLIDTVKSCLGLPPAEIIACIMRTADTFAAGAKQNDDMTLVVLCAPWETGTKRPQMLTA